MRGLGSRRDRRRSKRDDRVSWRWRKPEGNGVVVVVGERDASVGRAKAGGGEVTVPGEVQQRAEHLHSGPPDSVGSQSCVIRRDTQYYSKLPVTIHPAFFPFTGFHGKGHSHVGCAMSGFSLLSSIFNAQHIISKTTIVQVKLFFLQMLPSYGRVLGLSGPLTIHPAKIRQSTTRVVSPTLQSVEQQHPRGSMIFAPRIHAGH